MNGNVKEPSENTLALLRQQDVAAFTELVRTNESLITGLCKAMGLRGADLEDATAEAFAEVYRSLPRYEGRSSVSTWTYRIACRVIWRIRAERKKLRLAEYNDDNTAAQSPSPTEIAQRRQSAERIWLAVAELEPRQATAVELYYRGDYSIDEIAEKMECPAGTVKTLLHRARAALRERLKGEA